MSSWPVVICDGEQWFVAPVYVHAVARHDVLRICGEWGCEPPSKKLVKAVWKAADLKINPWSITRSPSTFENMRSARALSDQLDVIEKLAEKHGEFTLLCGSHKDFAWVAEGRLDLFGWYQDNGMPIEDGATSHDEWYVDYSQGLRLVCRAPYEAVG